MTDDKITLRVHQPGDMGWIVSRHGALYAQEYGWNSEFEALVAEIAAQFLREFVPDKHVCFIAWLDNQRVGSALVTSDENNDAKLRLVLVEPDARGLGIGRQLVKGCMQFASAAGYQRMTLWTNSVLVAARQIYIANGFTLQTEEPHHSFGHDLVGQHWARDLPLA
jgi:GNAT superfamily N-acetyltransferase